MTDERDRGDANDLDDADAADHSDTTDSPTGPMTDIAPDTDDDRASTTADPESDLGDEPGGDPEGDANGGDGRFGRLSTDDLRGYIDRIGLAALILLALIAGWSFYSQAGRAIRTWLDPAFQPIALAAFNLAVLLVALAGVAHQLSRIRRSEGGGGEGDG
ncbi:hypothetical protein [Halorubrum amylolyticum]|uniref:hypothetical protein n=1 Tax=Halorubrum amylolyticum TaxID=2508724 RepID=UPI0010086EC8|nr:hypothetical protein [Halorubrum amylolyticum]